MSAEPSLSFRIRIIRPELVSDILVVFLNKSMDLVDILPVPLIEMLLLLQEVVRDIFVNLALNLVVALI